MFDAAAGFGGINASPAFGAKAVGGLLATSNRPENRAPSDRSRPSRSRQPRGARLDRTAKLYVGGKQARPTAAISRAVWGPRGALLGHVGLGNRKDIRNAVEAAQAAKGWARATGHARAQVIYYIAENLSARASEFAARLHADDRETAARPKWKRRFERLFVYCRMGRQMGWRGEIRANPWHRAGDERGRSAVIGALCPDEAPLLGLNLVMAPRDRDGQTPACWCPRRPFPLAATDLYQVLDTSDLPGGVVNIVTGGRGRIRQNTGGAHGR